MLFTLEKGGKYFLSIGSTPAALPLEELDMHFCGPLPPDTVNEQEVPSDIRRELTDPLAAGQKVKALKIHVGPKLTCIMYGADKVQTFEYSVHLGQEGFLLRRSPDSLPLLAGLIISGGILQLTSEALSRILDESQCKLRKNATKTQKVRAICSLDLVLQHVKKACISKVLALCDKLDEKRLQKTGAQDTEQDEEDEEDEEAATRARVRRLTIPSCRRQRSNGRSRVEAGMCRNVIQYAETLALDASGHVDRFSDFLVRDAQDERKFFRADKLLEDVMEEKLKEKGLSDEKVKEYTVVRNQADAYSQEEITEIFRKYDIRSPESGNKLTDPEPFNLMFPTPIGPAGLIQGYLRPETAQGIFLNYKFCLEQNAGRLPFGVAQVGKSFRNEIAPRQGLTRQREFTQAEIEWFVKPNAKDMKKFKAVKSLELQLFSSEQQLAGGSPKKVAIGDAVASGMVNNETLGYFIARTYLFLVSLGIKAEHCRFRQHLPTEMAHYATDCWDAEIETCYGWLECVGIADRACFDLSAHAKAAKVDLAFRETLEKPIEMEVLRLTKEGLMQQDDLAVSGRPSPVLRRCRLKSVHRGSIFMSGVMGHFNSLSGMSCDRPLLQSRLSTHTHSPVILSFACSLLAAHRHPGIMGCSSSASVMHDDLEDTSLTRVIFTDWHTAFPALPRAHLVFGVPRQAHECAQDASGQQFVEHSAPFKDWVLARLNKFLASVEQNLRMLEKKEAGIKVMKTFGKNGRPIKEWLEKLPQDELKSLIADATAGSASRSVELPDGKTEECKFLAEHLACETKKEKQSTTTFTPGVVEPSFGIDRILFSVLEHTYYARPKEASDDKQTRGVLAFPSAIAPYKMTILPQDQRIQRDEKYPEIMYSMQSQVTELGHTCTVDDSNATLGKRYARNDELGIPFACTVDFTSLEDSTVTLRERDSMVQIRLPAAEIGELLDDLCCNRKSWEEAQKRYPVQK
eukprot:s1198_g2.t3